MIDFILNAVLIACFAVLALYFYLSRAEREKKALESGFLMGSQAEKDRSVRRFAMMLFYCDDPVKDALFEAVSLAEEAERLEKMIQ